MKNKAELVLKEALQKIKPSSEELKKIKNSVEEFVKKLKGKIKSSRLKAEIFIGGSFAKKSIIKKDHYDIDIFIRFNKEYKDKNLSELIKKELKNFGNVSLIHGSRDYFRIELFNGLYLEIIPVLAIKNPNEAENITDLSYLHVKYINKKINSEKILNDILIAKAFCYSNNCYGAESYINGFSGYSLELLIYYYKGFLNFIKAVTKMKNEPSKGSQQVRFSLHPRAKMKNEKIMIDIEKHFKNKQDILRDLNSSKLHSPIILIDPTYKQRNVLAALSYETFEKFKKACGEFLKKPSIKYFEAKKIDLEKIKNNAKKKKLEFILIKTSTDKQEGDIAGSKLIKFYRHLDFEIKKYFEIKSKGFEYNGKKSSTLFFVVKNKKGTLVIGPSIKESKHVKKFKKKHKKTFEKKGRIYAREKVNLGIKEFLENWKIKNKKKMEDMSIEKLEIID